MTPELLIKSFFALLISGMFAWTVFSRYDHEIGSEKVEDGKQRYLPYLPSMLLPVIMLILLLLSIPEYGLWKSIQMMFGTCFGIFLHISVYYVVLLLLMPLLQKWISARSCAFLWMLPNYLYFTLYDIMEVQQPLLVIRMEPLVFRILVGVWFAGFAVVMLWKLTEHLVFRRKVLKESQPVTDSQILSVWEAELERAMVKKPKCRLVTSPHVRTPLSVGFFNRTIRVVLPERTYQADDLVLVLRHELIHICRADSTNKFFLLFCAAVCWFNPMMWIAKRKSADDLERSCDETVLLDAQEGTRRQYAELVLRTAGDEKGFTTCLSASATALRYRLKHIMKPPNRRSGALIAGLFLFVSFMSWGYAALAVDSSTGAQTVFRMENTQQIIESSAFEVKSVSFRHEEPKYLSCKDPDGLMAYLAGLELSYLAGNYSFYSDRALIVVFDGPDGAFGITLRDRALTVSPLHGDMEQTVYYLEKATDWDEVLSLIK